MQVSCFEILLLKPFCEICDIIIEKLFVFTFYVFLRNEVKYVTYLLRDTMTDDNLKKYYNLMLLRRLNLNKTVKSFVHLGAIYRKFLIKFQIVSAI